MLGIARWTIAHRRIVVVAWIVAAVGVLALAGSVGKKTASSFTLPGTGSQQAVDLLKSRFPAQAGDADQIVFHARSGTLQDALGESEDPSDARADRAPPPRHRGHQPLRPGPARGLERRHDRIRDGELRRARKRPAESRC